jgi:hypothetical protein
MFLDDGFLLELQDGDFRSLAGVSKDIFDALFFHFSDPKAGRTR